MFLASVVTMKPTTTEAAIGCSEHHFVPMIVDSVLKSTNTRTFYVDGKPKTCTEKTYWDTYANTCINCNFVQGGYTKIYITHSNSKCPEI